ncbi:MAG: hypothetical protein QS721_03220 [Candidatus Endonucleobacter sp. (ex Gigantidas childressi)]|nr:hypothetical protein [Candidatus Endonucleobacter sp. (ex Gigantidas childressi)]
MPFIVTELQDSTVVQAHSRGQDAEFTGSTSDSVNIKLDDDVVCTRQNINTKDCQTAKNAITDKMVKQMSDAISCIYDDKLASTICVDLPASIPQLGQIAAQTLTIAGFTAATSSEDKGNLIYEALGAARLTRDQNEILSGSDDVVFLTELSVSSYLDRFKVLDKINGFKMVVANRLNKTSLPKLLGVVLPKQAVACLISNDPQVSMEFDQGKSCYYTVSALFGRGILNTTGVVFIVSD